jgi:hypothetical protein
MSRRGSFLAIAILLAAPRVAGIQDLAAVAPIVDAGPPSGGDDGVLLQSLLSQGFVVSLRPGAVYQIARRLNVIANGSGIITVGTPATLQMTNAFANMNPYRMFDYRTTDSVGILAANLYGAGGPSGLRFENFKMTKPHLDGSYVGAIWMRGVSQSTILGLELSGFSLGAIIALDSVTSVSVRSCTIRDSWAGTVSSNLKHRALPQLTGIVVDDNKLNGIGSRCVVIANNTIRRLRFKPSLFHMERQAFRGFAGDTSPVGYQTDGITVIPGGTDMSIVANVIDVVGEGIDAMANRILIEANQITNAYDFGLKLVHGASHCIARGNEIRAAGTAAVTVAGSPNQWVGNTFGNIIRGTRISEVGRLAAFCSGTADPGFAIHTTCPSQPAAAAIRVERNGGLQVPFYNMFFDNSVVASRADPRLHYFVQVDAGCWHSLFYGNDFTDLTGRGIGNSLNPGAIGTELHRDDEPGGPLELALADFDGNGLDDILVTWNGSGNNRLFRKNQDRTVTPAWSVLPSAAINGYPDNVRSGDFNGDGRGDLMFHWRMSGANRFFYGTPNGGFVAVLDPIHPNAINDSPDVVTGGDFNGDGRHDLLSYWRASGRNRFFYGTQNYGFIPAYDPIPTGEVGASPGNVLVGDYDGDGSSDLMFHWPAAGTNRTYYGIGTGTFARVFNAIPFGAVNGSPDLAIVLDAEPDGCADIDFFWTGTSERRLFLGRRNRTFVAD